MAVKIVLDRANVPSEDATVEQAFAWPIPHPSPLPPILKCPPCSLASPNVAHRHSHTMFTYGWLHPLPLIKPRYPPSKPAPPHKPGPIPERDCELAMRVGLGPHGLTGWVGRATHPTWPPKQLSHHLASGDRYRSFQLQPPHCRKGGLKH